MTKPLYLYKKNLYLTLWLMQLTILYSVLNTVVSRSCDSVKAIEDSQVS